MCGRYAITTDPEVLAALLGVAETPDFDVRYNLAPTQYAPVARVEGDGQRHVSSLRWGLVPSWAKDASIGNRTLNARSETAAEKPSFRSAWKQRRCIVPASWFYEWKREGKQKVPYRIERRDGEALTFAGLWERWKGAAETPGFDSFTILTTASNGTLRALHDRMPVILVDAGARERWLDCAHDDPLALSALMAPAPEDLLQLRPVSTKVNNVRNEGPSILEDGGLFAG
ncbi:MAG: SOS response-associated peptidase [Planctomycetota bacterium]